MSASDNVVIHHPIDPALFDLAIAPIEKIHHGGENNHIGHLPGYGTRLSLVAAQEAAHLFGQGRFHRRDEISSLVVKYFCIGKRFDRFVFGIAAGRVHDGEHAHHL